MNYAVSVRSSGVRPTRNSGPATDASPIPWPARSAHPDSHKLGKRAWRRLLQASRALVAASPRPWRVRIPSLVTIYAKSDGPFLTVCPYGSSVGVRSFVP